MGEIQTMSMSGFSGSEGSKGVYTAVFRGKSMSGRICLARMPAVRGSRGTDGS